MILIRLLLASLLGALVLQPAAAQSRPNILLIVADDLGYGDLGCQGNPQIPTPHIDSLAKNGVRFTNGYVSGPYCSPTRAGLMTGRYQQRFGHEFNPGPAEQAVKQFGISTEEKLLPERLKAAGYVTGMFGKWHLGYEPAFHPQRRGFDEFFGFLGGAHSYLVAGADPRNLILRGDTPVEEKEYLTDAFAREAVAFIAKHAGKPWFVYLPFNAVHTPMHATEKYEKRFAHITDARRRTFAAMLSAMDDGVGAVLGMLKELRLEENTLIFFVSDNGGPTAANTSVNGPLRGFKAQTWEGGVRVPFLVQWKARLPAGKTEDRPVIQLDILPTALAAAGVARAGDEKLDGVDLTPFLRGEKTGVPHDALYWRFGPQMAIRMGNWKLVKGAGAGAGIERRERASAEGAELYDLSSDIGEKNNLATKHPEKVRELAAAWTKWSAELAEPKWFPDRGAAGAKKKKNKQ